MSTLNVLLPVVVGALLTLLAAEWRSTRERRRVEAARIRDSFAAFVQSVTDYTREWSAQTVISQPSAIVLDQRRRDLASTLRRVVALYGRSPLATHLLEDLDGDKYRTQLTSAWQGRDPTFRQERAARVDELVAALDLDCENLARTVETSYPKSALRKSPSPISTSYETA